MEAFSAALAGGGQFQDSVRALERAEADVVIDAASSLVIGEAAVVLGEKGWSLADAERAVARTGGFPGPSRATILAALAEPDAVSQHLRSGWQERFGLVVDVLRIVGFLRRLPTLAPIGPPRGAAAEHDRRHAKVRALLAKAESTPYEAEASACTAKAQELMARYAIDDAVLGGGNAPSGAASSMRVVIETPYAKPKAILLSAVAKNNRCRAVWDSDYGFSTVFGGSRDLWDVDLLYTSLLVQAVVTMHREQERSRSFRHAFLLAFAHRIGERLREANAMATTAAAAGLGRDVFLPVLAARRGRGDRGAGRRLSPSSTDARDPVERVRCRGGTEGRQRRLDCPGRAAPSAFWERRTTDAVVRRSQNEMKVVTVPRQ